MLLNSCISPTVDSHHNLVIVSDAVVWGRQFGARLLFLGETMPILPTAQ